MVPSIGIVMLKHSPMLLKVVFYTCRSVLADLCIATSLFHPDFLWFQVKLHKVAGISHAWIVEAAWRFKCILDKEKTQRLVAYLFCEGAVKVSLTPNSPMLARRARRGVSRCPSDDTDRARRRSHSCLLRAADGARFPGVPFKIKHANKGASLKVGCCIRFYRAHKFSWKNREILCSWHCSCIKNENK